MKNKKGTVYTVALISLILFMVGMTLINFIKPEVATVRSQLNCDAPATDGTKLMCLNIDLALLYFIVLVLSIAGGVITDKLLV